MNVNYNALIACLLMIAAPASAGGLVLVLPDGAELVDVSAPTNATVSSTVVSQHVVVTITGPDAGPVLVTGGLNETTVVIGGFLPPDPEPVDLQQLIDGHAALTGALQSLNASLWWHEHNATVRALNASQTFGLQAGAINSAWASLADGLDALGSNLHAARLQVADLQNGTALVSTQVAALRSEVDALNERKVTVKAPSGTVAMFAVLLLALVAQEARFWVMRRRSTGGGSDHEEFESEGLSFADSEDS